MMRDTTPTPVTEELFRHNVFLRDFSTISYSQHQMKTQIDANAVP